MFCGDAIDIIAMVSTISKVVFLHFQNYLVSDAYVQCNDNLEGYSYKTNNNPRFVFKICNKRANHCSKQCVVGNFCHFQSFFVFTVDFNLRVQFLLQIMC